jgi:type III pantothenate kinase
MDEKKQISLPQETSGLNKLIIDFGNTLTKIAVYNKNDLIHLQTIDLINTQLLREIQNIFQVEQAIISSVSSIPTEVMKYLSNHFSLIQLNHKTPIPIVNLYQTPETLGNDRLAVVVAASAMHQLKNCLVIDAGTCITYDFVNHEKKYFGGSISPGMLLRFKALNTFTSRLPLVPHRNFEGLTGATTEESVQSGIINGIVSEIEGIIGQYKLSFPDLLVFITGGDMNFFAKKLKSNIFAVPNLVLVGLNEILEFNVGK